MAETPLLDQVLRRDRAVTIAALAVLCLLAWSYVLTGAGLGASPWRMTRLSLFPHAVAAAGMDMDGMGQGAVAPAWGAATWALMFAMWWTMMVAMMGPSAAPAILLYGRVRRRAEAQGQASGVGPTGAFAAAYLVVWLGFAICAVLAQWALQRAGLLSAEAMGSQSRWLSAALLAAAGAYQLTPLHSGCLNQCRSPAQFISRHWRPGAAGAVRLGVLHGAYCVGCCWMLMALLFVGGVMNLAWIAVLSLLVAAEKLLPGGPWIGRAAGAVLMAWAVATLLI